MRGKSDQRRLPKATACWHLAPSEMGPKPHATNGETEVPGARRPAPCLPAGPAQSQGEGVAAGVGGASFHGAPGLSCTCPASPHPPGPHHTNSQRVAPCAAPSLSSVFLGGTIVVKTQSSHCYATQQVLLFFYQKPCQLARHLRGSSSLTRDNRIHNSVDIRRGRTGDFLDGAFDRGCQESLAKAPQVPESEPRV